MAPFGSAIGGGGGELQAAMQRRGMDSSVLDQVSPSAPTSPDRGPMPTVPAGAPSAMPQGMPQSQGLPPQGQPGGLPVNSGEASILIKALDSRLKTLSKLDEAQLPATAGQI